MIAIATIGAVPPATTLCRGRSKSIQLDLHRRRQHRRPMPTRYRSDRFYLATIHAQRGASHPPGAGRHQEGHQFRNLFRFAIARDPGLRDAPKTLASIYHNTNRHPESIAMLEEELKVLRGLHGPEHPDVANCLDNLGVEFIRVRRFEEAEPLLLETLRQGEKFYGSRDPLGYHAHAGLSRVAASRQRWDQQVDYARKGLEAANAAYPVGHRYRRVHGLLPHFSLQGMPLMAAREGRQAPVANAPATTPQITATQPRIMSRPPIGVIAPRRRTPVSAIR